MEAVHRIDSHEDFPKEAGRKVLQQHHHEDNSSFLSIPSPSNHGILLPSTLEDPPAHQKESSEGSPDVLLEAGKGLGVDKAFRAAADVGDSSEAIDNGENTNQQADTAGELNELAVQRHVGDREFELKRDVTAGRPKQKDGTKITAKAPRTALLIPNKLEIIGDEIDENSNNTPPCKPSIASGPDANGHVLEGNANEKNPNIDDIFSTIMSSVKVQTRGAASNRLSKEVSRIFDDASGKPEEGKKVKTAPIDISNMGESDHPADAVLEKMDRSLPSSLPDHDRKQTGQVRVEESSIVMNAAGGNNDNGVEDAGIKAPTMEDIFSKVMSDKKGSTKSAPSLKTGKSNLLRQFSFTGINHIAFCVENLERSLDFYCGMLGLDKNLNRPDLPYRGAWLFLGTEGIHIMEVPNPDPVNGRPDHGGFDRHACINCMNVEGVRLALEAAGIPYQASVLPSLFTRDPDGNGLEFIEVSASKGNFLEA